MKYETKVGYVFLATQFTMITFNQPVLAVVFGIVAGYFFILGFQK